LERRLRQFSTLVAKRTREALGNRTAAAFTGNVLGNRIEIILGGSTEAEPSH
jgi:hypothetical protein